MIYTSSNLEKAKDKELYKHSLLTYEKFEEEFFPLCLQEHADIFKCDKYPIPSTYWAKIRRNEHNPLLQAAYKNFKKENHYYDVKDLFWHTSTSLNNTLSHFRSEYNRLYFKKPLKHKFKSKYYPLGEEKWYLTVDYMYIDEIQDISLDVLKTLCEITIRNVMLFGDNAQNIAKGISTRFDYL